jgi:hypothetical protein
MLSRPLLIASTRSLIPIVVDDLSELLASLGNPERQRSALGAIPGESKRVPISALQGKDDSKALRRKYAAVIGTPEILTFSSKLGRVIGKNHPSTIHEDETCQRILSLAVELEQGDLVSS